MTHTKMNIHNFTFHAHGILNAVCLYAWVNFRWLTSVSSTVEYLYLVEVVYEDAYYSSIRKNVRHWIPAFSYNHLKLQFGVILTCSTVTMVTYYVEKITITCSPIIGHVLDTIFVECTVKERLYSSIKV